MKKGKELTPVVRLISLVWMHAGGDKNVFSWELYNHQVRDAVLMAAAGFPWEEGDMDDVMSFGNYRCSIDRCLTGDGVEEVYREAVVNRNMSACQELERWFGRVPIIADDVDGRKRERLYVGAQTFWNDELVRVNSFKPDGRANMCSYYDPFTMRGKVKHRYTISAADVKAARKAAKQEQNGVSK